MARIFALLPPHYDTVRHHARFLAGEAPDSSPWGLDHAAKFGHAVTFSNGHVFGRFACLDVRTWLANLNVAEAARIGLNDVVCVEFGISTESFAITPPRLRTDGPIAAIGGDKHCDWDTVAIAARAFPQCTFRVATIRSVPQLDGLTNTEIGRCNTIAEMNALYDGAHMVIIGLKPNTHASGLTVMLEAVARGVPVVCADEGGLGDYFGDDAVFFFGPDRAFQTVEQAIAGVRADPADALARAQRAQARFVAQGYDSVSWVGRFLKAAEQAPRYRALAPQPTAR